LESTLYRASALGCRSKKFRCRAQRARPIAASVGQDFQTLEQSRMLVELARQHAHRLIANVGGKRGSRIAV
jgi:hypothetical protein